MSASQLTVIATPRLITLRVAIFRRRNARKAAVAHRWFADILVCDALQFTSGEAADFMLNAL
jgi:hypothetical protein